MTYVDTTQRDEYTATSGQTVFAYTSRILVNTDLQVYDEGVLQALTTHYTVSGVGSAGGGNVTFVTGITLNNTVILLRNMGEDQNTDYTPSGPFQANDHETALDKLTMKSQDLREIVNRAIKFAVTSLLNDIDAPEGTSASDRGGKVWAWDSAGTGLELLAATIIDAVSVIAVKGDIVQGDASGDAAKLAIGGTGAIPNVVSGLLAYLAIGADMDFFQILNGTGKAQWGKLGKSGATVVSANALPLLKDGMVNAVSGTTTINTMDTVGVGGIKILNFTGALQLTNSANIILPNGLNITTITNDVGMFHEVTTGVWKLVAWTGHVLNHTHLTAAQGGVLTKVLLSAAGIGSTPDANTLYKDNIITATCTFDGTGTPAYSANKFNFDATAITDNGTGDYTLTIDRNLAAATYAGIVSVEGSGARIAGINNIAVGTVDIKVFNDAGTAVDDNGISVTLIGAQ